MIKSKFSLRKLFSNKKFLMLFSIVLAFIFWIAVALEYAPIVENVIEAVPVNIDIKNSVPDKYGLQIFGNNDYSVDIEVRGSRYIVGGELLSASDFDVTAQTAYVNSSGMHSLDIKVTPKSADPDFEIVSVSPEHIDVYFDKYEEKEISVEARINTELENIAADGLSFDAADIILPTNTVKITGAKTEIDRIEKAYADINIDKKLTQSTTADAQITLVGGETDEEFTHVKINGNDSMTIPVSIPVYKTVELPTSVTFENSPSAYLKKPLSYTCSPSTMKVAVLVSGEKDDESISVGTIDFAKLKNGKNTFEFNTNALESIKVLDSTKTVRVDVNIDSVSAKTITPDNVNVVFENGDTSYNYDPDSLKDITVIGDSTTLGPVTAKDITVTVNSTDADNANSAVLPVTVTCNKNDCWVFGDYTIKIIKK